MWLVLCDPFDAAALWAYRGLSARGLNPLELISTEVLLRALTWEHRLGVDGIRLRISLAKNRTITHDSVRGVLNRLSFIDPQLLAPAPQAERNYATQEMTALFMSWLAALPCPVLNRPVAQGLSGSWRHPSEWNYLAAQAGLATHTYRQSASEQTSKGLYSGLTGAFGFTAHTVFVVRESFVHCRTAALPLSINDACLRLGALARTDLLGIQLSADDSWTFLSATPQPDLRAGGAGLLNALTFSLRDEARKEQ